MEILGWVLIVLGVAFICLSFVGAARDLFQKRPTVATANSVGEYTAFGKMLVELLKVLFTGPAWFLFFIVGLALVYAGTRLVAGQSVI